MKGILPATASVWRVWPAAVLELRLEDVPGKAFGSLAIAEACEKPRRETGDVHDASLAVRLHWNGGCGPWER